MSDTTRQQQIITATIECIEKHGVHGTTIRRIAEAAGGNSAAISYYFRGKDNLVALALEQALENAFDWEDFASCEALPAVDRVIAIFEDLVEGALRYPGTARALFYQTLTQGDYDTPAVRSLTGFLEQLTADLKGRGVAMGDEDLRLAVAQTAAASFVMVALAPRIFDRFVKQGFDDKDFRRLYLRRLAESLFRG